MKRDVGLPECSPGHNAGGVWCRISPVRQMASWHLGLHMACGGSSASRGRILSVACNQFLSSKRKRGENCSHIAGACRRHDRQGQRHRTDGEENRFPFARYYQAKHHQRSIYCPADSLQGLKSKRFCEEPAVVMIEQSND